MKRIHIICIILTLLLAGYASADLGMPATPETQGIETSTTINMLGNFASNTELQWRITNSMGGLPEVPPLEPEVFSGIIESVYTEDTMNHGTGLIAYDKELDVETSAQITGQWNIEAIKELSFVGIDGARVISADTIMVDGAANPYVTELVINCPFASDVTELTPTYCNRAQAGSSIDMTVANVRTTSTDRFVMSYDVLLPVSASGDVELNHDIRVSEFVTDLPSMGMASAYMDVLIQEAYGGQLEPGNIDPFTTLAERIEFHESTTIDGDITLFEKMMHYESGFVR
ncbi:MAG TPA: hypothetical protein VMW63_00615 [Methanoregulaceae archaeon]|nr:hypothetical protein [Methanoregulaceae archaeon]